MAGQALISRAVAQRTPLAFTARQAPATHLLLSDRVYVLVALHSELPP